VIVAAGGAEAADGDVLGEAASGNVEAGANRDAAHRPEVVERIDHAAARQHGAAVEPIVVGRGPGV
jgi:hypothetical protein